MNKTICAVCKQPIDDALVVLTHKGPVHPGVCLQHAEEFPVTEKSEELLESTELLL